MQSLADIRRTFTDFFKNNDHEGVRSSPLVPQNDPTLLFTNAGMVQFKDVFTGKEKRPYQRAVTAQKCLRAGGKHNDLDNVGYTARHHTFFEMLGNFSFGDYFKEQAIHHAWTLVTKNFHLDPSRLLVTVYAEDEEAATLWRKIAGLRDDRILRISTSDNFWSMGDTGPCGPCSEIFYDHGEGIPGGVPGSADQDGDRFIEIWNLVFMQFEQHADGTRTNLPNPSIDTGMGLERMAAVIQGVHNNYDIDLFKTLIATAQDLVGNSGPQNRQSYNVIADHIRASSFLIADGVLPSNEGRGYVLRRIMRRGMRHAHKLGSQDPLMYRLVPTLVSLMGEAYPELVRAQPLVQQILHQEEEKFRQTLERGLKLLQESTTVLLPAQALPAEVAFKLYDTFGFPLDLTQDVLRAEGRTVDEAGFQTCMAEQKQKARAAWVGSGDTANEQVWFDFHQQFGATEFLGYTTTEAEGTVCALVINEQSVEEAKQGQDVMILTNQTPFYAESGGQMGDHGFLTTEEGAVVTITDTLKKVGSLHVHVGHIEKGQLKTGQTVKLNVDRDRRRQLAANHSATHLLHAALRQTFGKHVTQKGSLVAPDRLRFDFTHPRPVTKEELAQVEQAVNQRIFDNQETLTRVMTPDQAIEEGAMALFGERYGEEVRVVSMADSVELCGGTHVEQLGTIGLFKITGESPVSAGIRRIEAITGPAILTLLAETQKTLSAEREQNRKQVTELQKQLGDIKRQTLLDGESDNAQTITIKGYPAMVHHLKGVPARDLKALVDRYKQTLGSGLVIVTSIDDDKVALVIGVTPDLTDRLDAVKLVKIGAEILGGQGGGGRPDLAQAGGSNPENIGQLLEVLSQGM
ncbi:alanine--tRNA ligase [Candidatus Finniella inopinata]|uniref:Alanine--tRNA ligase n=1 Tax=Candidatus Finniella inopinata TaxID=1696036 RepID=A0A4Q7DF20_9PROT|nr:alanine--tRNA ligase [Candidatus Finniella inopinata]RZI45283.1 alanine--tRNA ligase [Candidatus Finniella inopinata]